MSDQFSSGVTGRQWRYRCEKKEKKINQSSTYYKRKDKENIIPISDMLTVFMTPERRQCVCVCVCLASTLCRNKGSKAFCFVFQAFKFVSLHVLDAETCLLGGLCVSM